jgi:hypothetical protein
LIGVLFVFGIKFRRELPEGFKRAFGTGMLPTILLNIAIGFMIPVIDNAAHLGGLAAGALLALIFGYKRPGARSGVAVLWHVLQIAALALVVVSFVMVARNFNKAYDTPDTTATGYLNAINGGQAALVKALNEGDPGGIDEAVKALDWVAPPTQAAGSLRDELKAILVKARGVLIIPPAKRTKKEARAWAEVGAAYDAWVEKRDEWVRTEGKDYGFYLPEPPPEVAPAREK